MITVCVDGTELALSDVSEAWLIEQIQRRRADNVPVCIRISIRTPDINATLATSGCPGGGGGGREPNPAEKRVLDLWGHHKLNEDDFAPGQLVAFLKQVEPFCR